MDDQPNLTQRKQSRFRPLHSFSLQTLFVAMTLCAVAAPSVPPTLAQIEAWWHPPQNSGTRFIRLVYPRGVIGPEEEEDRLAPLPEPGRY